MPDTCCVSRNDIAEVEGSLTELDLCAGSLPEHRGLVIGFLDLDSDRDLGGLLVQTIVTCDCLEGEVVKILKLLIAKCYLKNNDARERLVQLLLEPHLASFLVPS